MMASMNIIGHVIVRVVNFKPDLMLNSYVCNKSKKKRRINVMYTIVYTQRKHYACMLLRVKITNRIQDTPPRCCSQNIHLACKRLGVRTLVATDISVKTGGDISTAKHSTKGVSVTVSQR